MLLACLILGLFLAPSAFAYPEFIGYKYSSCLTCHYNGHGNGPLNDYGRALWSAEIAGTIWSRGKSDEQLAESSGFLGRTELPWWIRPGIKARQLAYQINPPAKKTQSVTMQAEANLALFADKSQKYAFIGSFGYVPVPQRLKGLPGEDVDEWISREHYFRIQALKDLWLYLGMTDKVYGIRIVDHTAYSRDRVGLAQNDQSHGLVLHYIQSKWEATLNLFAGNLYQEENLRQQGASFLYEYELKNAWRIGTTGLYSSNKFVGNSRLGILTKYGAGEGAALLFEAGFIDDAIKGGESTRGYYLFSELFQKVFRGYHLFVTGQAYKRDMTSGQADSLRTGIGMLAFPMARTEVRIGLENNREYTSSSEVAPETWALLMQFHLSL